MDKCPFQSEIYIVIVNSFQETLQKHGGDEQNGFLIKKWCIDRSFGLRDGFHRAFHTRKSFGYDTWVLFIDLVKAFELWIGTSSSNPEIYGTLNNLVNIVISKIHKDARIKFTYGETTIEFKSTAGVKQNDNLAPTHFLFMINKRYINNRRWV